MSMDRQIPDFRDRMASQTPSSMEVGEVLDTILDLQRKKGHIPYWSSLGSREEDQDVLEICATRCWAEERSRGGWRLDLDSIRINRKKQVSKKSTKLMKLDPPDCLAEMDGGTMIGVEVSMLSHPQANHYWKLPQSVREIPWIEEPGPHVLDQWREKPMSPNTYKWTPEELQKALGNIVKKKNKKIENKRVKDSCALSHLAKLYLVIPMDEAWLDGTLGKDTYWTVEGQIIEVRRPRSIDGVYVMGSPMPGQGGKDQCLVSEVRLIE